jgi:hypothetical protein
MRVTTRTRPLAIRCCSRSVLAATVVATTGPRARPAAITPATMSNATAMPTPGRRRIRVWRSPYRCRSARLTGDHPRAGEARRRLTGQAWLPGRQDRPTTRPATRRQSQDEDRDASAARTSVETMSPTARPRPSPADRDADSRPEAALHHTCHCGEFHGNRQNSARRLCRLSPLLITSPGRP